MNLNLNVCNVWLPWLLSIELREIRVSVSSEDRKHSTHVFIFVVTSEGKW